MTGKVRKKKTLELVYNELRIHYVHQICSALLTAFRNADQANIDLKHRSSISFSSPDTCQNIGIDFVREGEMRNNIG